MTRPRYSQHFLFLFHNSESNTAHEMVHIAIIFFNEVIRLIVVHGSVITNLDIKKQLARHYWDVNESVSVS